MTHPTQALAHQGQFLDRLLEAIELIKANRHAEALPILRGIIQQDSNCEEAWLWMSVVVDDIDQSIICLDNVLRINPKNEDALTALYRLRQRDLASERQRGRLRRNRDLAIMVFWLLVTCIIMAVLYTFAAQVMIA